MKRIVVAFACAMSTWVVASEPVKVIFDSDMITDFDDVGALACLHALADACECEILATVSATRGNASVGAIEVINRYYGRGDLPVGAPKGIGVIGEKAGATEKVRPDAPLGERIGNDGGHYKYRKLLADYPGWYRYADADDAPDANDVYRRVLAAQPDRSVTICSVGFLTNLRRLLETKPDSISPLDGRELVGRKVRLWVAMACKYPVGKEYNSKWDAESSRIVLENWPTPVVFTDFEYGKDCFAGRAIAETPDPGAGRNPVRDVFAGNIPACDEIASDPAKWLRRSFGVGGRSAWDETAVLIAVRGTDPYFNVERGMYRMVGDDGTDEWVPDAQRGPHLRITEKLSKAKVAGIIDELMLRGPRDGARPRAPEAQPAISSAAMANVASLRQAVWNEASDGDSFSVTCTVTAVIRADARYTSYWVADDTGYGYMRATNSLDVAPGDRIVAQGHIGMDRFDWRRTFMESAVRLGRVEVPSPVSASPEQLGDESFDGRTVIMRGIVTDIVHDEIDPAWRFLLMRTDSTPFFAAVCSDGDEAFGRLLGAEIAAKGVATVLPDGGKRKFQTPQLTVASVDDITVETPPVEDPLDAPRIPSYPQKTLEGLRYKSVSALSRMGMRSVVGNVIAVYDDARRMLLKTADGQIVGAHLRKPADAEFGDCVAVAGFPETDLFIITLEKAICRRVPGGGIAADLPRTLPEKFAMEVVLRDICAHGGAVRIRGHVDEMDGDARVFEVRHGGHLIRVDFGAVAPHVDAVRSGSLVEVAGTCVRNTSSDVSRGFPRTAGFTVVPRTPEDLRIVAGPPWWTVGRMLAVVLVLVAALALAAVWNITLRRLAERRGRLLYKTKLESAAADLRVEERTRLAVELHDSIAQTLTGVSFQIDAAERTLPRDAGDAAGYIDAARKALLSCREELRRCLWDLRSETLAEPDLQNAIEKTIRPHIQNADVVIRFHASRHRIPDVIAHNVLSIIRELCVNAVKHGNAHKIRIAGELKNGALRFVVRDDGCGFDVENSPGPMQGHFGLQGIKERTRRLRGTLKLDSEIGKGTAATVEIPL